MDATDTTGFALLLTVVFSAIGMGYFVYGRRQQRAAALIAGALLMGYPYFVAKTWALVLLGVAFMALPWFIAL